MSQPHIHEVGAFEPTQAFAQTFNKLAAMIEGLRGDPEAVPMPEVARAFTESLDLLAVITQSTQHSMVAMMIDIYGEDVLNEALDPYRMAADLRDADENGEYNKTLMRKVAQFIPTEFTPDTDN